MTIVFHVPSVTMDMFDFIFLLIGVGIIGAVLPLVIRFYIIDPFRKASDLDKAYKKKKEEERVNALLSTLDFN